jgi:hypothetical protein
MRRVAISPRGPRGSGQPRDIRSARLTKLGLGWFRARRQRRYCLVRFLDELAPQKREAPALTGNSGPTGLSDDGPTPVRC